MSGSASFSLSAVTVSSSGLDGEVAASSSVLYLSVTIQSTGLVEGIGTSDISTLAVTVNTPTVATTGNASAGFVYFDRPSVYAVGTQPYIRLEELEITAVGATGANGYWSDIEGLNVRASGSGITGLKGSGAVTVPNVTVDGYSGVQGSIRLRESQVTGSAVTGISGFGTVYLPAIAVTGNTLSDRESIGAVVVAPVTLSGSGLGESIAQSVITLRQAQIASNGLSGEVGSATITVPLITVLANGFVDQTGYADITFYPPLVYATGVMELSDWTISGVAVNTRNQAVTTYSGLNITAMCQFQGLILAATDQGIVALTGETDLDELISVDVLSGITDFGVTEIKKIIAGYVSGRLSEDVKITLMTDTNKRRAYRLKEVGRDMQAHKTLFGLGEVGRHWQWGLQGSAEILKVSDIAFDVGSSKRRRL